MKVLAIKAVFPTGLKDSVKAAFPNLHPIIKPEFLPNSYRLNGHWIAGFTQADGSFNLNYYKASRMKLGYSVRPTFRITQHQRDIVVLKRIVEYFCCGFLSENRSRYAYDLCIGKISNLVDIILPFFQEYTIFGAKYLDLLDFKKGVYIVNNKGHLTP